MIPHTNNVEELKLQSDLSYSGRSASPLDYWARAITSQVVPRAMLPKRGLNITLSSYGLSHTCLVNLFHTIDDCPVDQRISINTIHHNISLASFPLLSNHAGPLPIFQLQENKGDGKDNNNFRLWDVSPFDITVMDGGLINELLIRRVWYTFVFHQNMRTINWYSGYLDASFPASLLGSDATMSSTCTINLDNMG